MPLLSDALFSYAMEQRVDGFLRAEREELDDSRRMVDYALEQLKAAGGAVADYAQRVGSGTATLSGINSKACFLAGLSVGLELGAMGHGR